MYRYKIYYYKRKFYKLKPCVYTQLSLREKSIFLSSIRKSLEFPNENELRTSAKRSLDGELRMSDSATRGEWDYGFSTHRNRFRPKFSRQSRSISGCSVAAQ